MYRFFVLGQMANILPFYSDKGHTIHSIFSQVSTHSRSCLLEFYQKFITEDMKATFSFDELSPIIKSWIKCPIFLKLFNLSIDVSNMKQIEEFTRFISTLPREIILLCSMIQINCSDDIQLDMAKLVKCYDVIH